MNDTFQIVCALLVALAGLAFVRWRFDPLYSVPTIGPSVPFLSYLGAYRYCRHAPEVLQEGYSRYKVFKVAMVDRWLVVVSGSDMNDELRKVPDSHMSFEEAAREFIQTKYTIAPDADKYPIHIAVIRGPLTRNLGVVFADVVDEVQAAFKEVLPVEGDEWIAVPVIRSMAEIVARATNRVFVGLPFCRNEEYLNTVVNFAFDVSKGRMILSYVPQLFKGIVGSMLPWSKRAINKVGVFIKPIIEERLRNLREHGDAWADKPNDYLMWLMDAAKKTGGSPDVVVSAMLVSNFAAIHTSSNSITHAIYHLAANPEYTQPMREEIEAVVKEEGWSKVAVGKMWKLDSFMRESQRINGIVSIAVMRKVLQDYTLSDGTYVPAGTLVAGAALATHYDEKHYERAGVFEPFRFSDMRAEESERIKHQFVSTSPEYIPFGHGKHACPGRFFAANELKLMMAHIILNYDVKLEGTTTRPANWTLWHSVLPARDARVLFRKRQAIITA
ncbi:cytochrome P450 [Laetiporus sulphureus 93-53]|uniref:Cytochrome P450 n=1 Tax=Laetiporus sulphureus 93-53 TaxID=1314785 RepID=A0A165C5H0_9APHY|nr:cytochrome P450 [Laetiporus sulphureus 93-53]KZT02240.1 cytochrome P450 [Laetiporus sulphureus 93-53]